MKLCDGWIGRSCKYYHNRGQIAYAKLKSVMLELALLQHKRLSGGYNMADVNANNVADWFIARANREREENFGEGISNLKLQKVLYFSQAARLALDSKPLFKDEIHAWDYGPVINSVYHDFKRNQNTAIKNPKGDAYEAFEPQTTAFLEDIWQLFGKYSAGKLVAMTHAHAPWKDTYDGTPNKVITKSSIEKYYKNVFVRT